MQTINQIMGTFILTMLTATAALLAVMHKTHPKKKKGTDHARTNKNASR